MAQSTISVTAVKEAVQARALWSAFWKAREDILAVAGAAEVGEQVPGAYGLVADAIWRLKDLSHAMSGHPSSHAVGA